MTLRGKLLKRSFDFTAAAFGLLVLWPLILVSWAIARKDTGASGFFRQQRVGRGGKLFWVVKLRTMRAEAGSTRTTVTTATDARITKWGARFRRLKIDELPQLWNVLTGEMSLVGPRPDVPGFLDNLPIEQQALLELRPGITGPATLKYRNEEALLATQPNPERYNDEVIWPDKVRINLDYLENWSMGKDLSYILQTVRG